VVTLTQRSFPSHGGDFQFPQYGEFCFPFPGEFRFTSPGQLRFPSPGDIYFPSPEEFSLPFPLRAFKGLTGSKQRLQVGHQWRKASTSLDAQFLIQRIIPTFVIELFVAAAGFHRHPAKAIDESKIPYPIKDRYFLTHEDPVLPHRLLHPFNHFVHHNLSEPVHVL